MFPTFHSNSPAPCHCDTAWKQSIHIFPLQSGSTIPQITRCSVRSPSVPTFRPYELINVARINREGEFCSKHAPSQHFQKLKYIVENFDAVVPESLTFFALHVKLPHKVIILSHFNSTLVHFTKEAPTIPVAGEQLNSFTFLFVCV